MHLNLNLNLAPNLNLNLNLALNLNLNLNPTGIRFPPTSKEGPKARPIVGLALEGGYFQLLSSCYEL